MMLLLHTKNFLLLLILIHQIMGDINVNCGRRCGKKMKPKKKLRHICSCEEIKQMPWAKAEERTAPSPTLHEPNWYVYKRKTGSHKLAINLTWSQSGDELTNMVKGYLLQIQQRRGPNRMFHVTFNCSFPIHEQVVFHFRCCERHMIRPEFYYDITIMSLPIFHEYTDTIKVTKDIHIPDCSNNYIAKTKRCTLKEKYQEYFIDQDDYETETPVHHTEHGKPETNYPTPEIIIVSVSVGTAALLIVVAFVIVFGRYKTHNDLDQCRSHSDTDGGSLLILTNTREDPIQLDAANFLATILGQGHKFNLWEQTLTVNPIMWLEEQLRFCSHVLLICTLHGNIYNKNNPDAYNMAVNACFNNKNIRAKVTAVYFEERISIPENFPRNVKYFQLMENFNGFLNHINSIVKVKISMTNIRTLQHKIRRIRTN